MGYLFPDEDQGGSWVETAGQRDTAEDTSLGCQTAVTKSFLKHRQEERVINCEQAAGWKPMSATRLRAARKAAKERDHAAKKAEEAV